MEELGDWQFNLDQLHHDFTTATPYPSIIIPNFIEQDFFRQLVREFPSIHEPGWHHYHNPIEKKYAREDVHRSPGVNRLFQIFQSDEFITMIRHITGIDNLENDPHLHGAGLHAHPREGKLDMHLDYSIHPITGKERRVNIIYFLNELWLPEWGGALELWNAEFTQCEREILPVGNTAAMFQTSDISWHGLPKPINCPADPRICRQSAAIYYVSDPRPIATHRLKAEFRPLPDQPAPSGLMNLYQIRPTRRLTPGDIIQQLGRQWETADIGRGYWFI